MAESVIDLVQGPATLYIAAFGAAEPADAAVNSSPAGSAWTNLGFTQGGATLSINQEYKALEVDQIVDVPGQRLVSRTIQVKTNLAGTTLTNLAIVMNDGTVGASGAGYAGTYDPDNASSATQPTYRALILDGWAPGDAILNRRIILRRVLSTESVEAAFQKDGQTLFPVTFTAHYVSSAVPLFHVVDQAAA